MTTDILVNLGLVLVFVLVGGVFAATEIALVSLRESRIRELDRRGGRGRRTATLARDPNRFLSAVQIGVTVAGFFSAAYEVLCDGNRLRPGDTVSFRFTHSSHLNAVSAVGDARKLDLSHLP